MSFRSFLKLVEIQTKVASMIPFLLGTFYALYRFSSFYLENFLLMLVSLLSIDMATTAINNYQDFKKAYKKHGYGYESHNAIVRYNLKESEVLTVIFILLTVGTVFGILLFFHTNMTVLILGAISFAVGIFYSFGPIPISRTPFGEIFSGGFMGLIIPFIAVYIHVFDQNLVNILWQSKRLFIEINGLEVLYIFLMSVPSAGGIANIMLANNICDIEDDIENKRYTLPIFIGKDHALSIFKMTYHMGYVALIILLALGAVPLISAIALFTVVFVNKNAKIFCEKQTKKDTFVLAVKNFVVMNMTLIVSIAIAAMIKHAI